MLDKDFSLHSKLTASQHLAWHSELTGWFLSFSLLIYDLQSEDWINTYYMLEGVLKECRPPKVSSEMKCTNEKMAWNTLIYAQGWCGSHHKWPRNCYKHLWPFGHHAKGLSPLVCIQWLIHDHLWFWTWTVRVWIQPVLRINHIQIQCWYWN